MRPYGLLRAGFPYLKTIGEFMRMHFPTDVAPARDGRLYVIGKGSMYTKGKSGPILVTNIEDDNLGSFGWKSYEESVADACFMWPMAIRLDVEQRELYVSRQRHTPNFGLHHRRRVSRQVGRARQ